MGSIIYKTLHYLVFTKLNPGPVLLGNKSRVFGKRKGHALPCTDTPYPHAQGCTIDIQCTPKHQKHSQHHPVHNKQSDVQFMLAPPLHGRCSADGLVFLGLLVCCLFRTNNTTIKRAQSVHSLITASRGQLRVVLLHGIGTTCPGVHKPDPLATMAGHQQRCQAPNWGVHMCGAWPQACGP